MGISETFRWVALAPAAGPNAPLTGYFRDQRDLLARVRQEHPELGHWSLQAIAEAWKRYSGDIHGILWLQYQSRDIAFLGYILLMSRDEARRLVPADAARCRTAFQDWASHQAAVARVRRQV